MGGKRPENFLWSRMGKYPAPSHKCENVCLSNYLKIAVFFIRLPFSIFRWMVIRETNFRTDASHPNNTVLVLDGINHSSQKTCWLIPSWENLISRFFLLLIPLNYLNLYLAPALANLNDSHRVLQLLNGQIICFFRPVKHLVFHVFIVKTILRLVFY